MARVRTVAAHAVVVPRRAACSNPGCEYVHWMAALVPGFEPLRVEGDLFELGEEAARAIDALETGAGGPYVRGEVEVVGGPHLRDKVEVAGARRLLARAYLAREPARWRALVERGDADALPGYPREQAAAEVLKPCCARAPGHPPPHDVVDPLS